MEKRLQEIKAGLAGTFKINQFLQLTDFLTELITKEMGMLKSVNIQEIEEIQPIKQEACGMYADMIRFLKENSSYLDSLAIQERSILKEVTENLSRLLDRNERMIKSFNEANKRVMEIFHEVVQSRISTNYGPEGKRRPPIRGYTNFSQSG
jgi:dsDNA-specific endonuclease/ATPase MutS2